LKACKNDLIIDDGSIDLFILPTRDTEEVFNGKLGAFAFMSAGPFIRVMLVGVATVLQIHPAREHCA